MYKMKDQTTIPPLDVWLRQTITQKTEETRPLVEANLKEAKALMSDLSDEITKAFPQYKTRVSHPFDYDIHDVLYQSVIGELTRLTVRKKRPMGKKVMTLDVLSHHEGNEVRYNFDEFKGHSRDEKLAKYVEQYFKYRDIYMSMKI